MKIVLTFDSFKGSMTAQQAVEAAREGVLSVAQSAEVVCLPMADGGEGTSEILCRYLNAKMVGCKVHDPLFRIIEGSYAVCADQKTAIMDLSTAAGLTLLAPKERNPMNGTTFGLGEMMLDAIQRGCRRLIIGIGGSATNDGGTGMLAALGYTFKDEQGNELSPIGRNLLKIASMERKLRVDLRGISMEAVCDVTNPLFGKEGAAHVYAPQKGANRAEVELLDRGLEHFAELAGINPKIAGSGAAGGLGYGLRLIGAKLKRGVDVVLQAARLEEHLRNADLLITGEGKIDRQTLSGKLPYGVLMQGRQKNVATIALAGLVEDRAKLLSAGFIDVRSILPHPNVSMEEAMDTQNAMKNLRNATSDVVKQYQAGKLIGTARK